MGFSELFNEFKLQENLHSLDDILNAIIDSDGMSFNDLKPIYKEFLLKLAVTLTKDELYQRSKSIMRRQKKKKLRKKNVASQVSVLSSVDGGTEELNRLSFSPSAVSAEASAVRGQEPEEGFSLWSISQEQGAQADEGRQAATHLSGRAVKKPDKPLGLTSWCPGHHKWFGCFRDEARDHDARTEP